MPLALKIHNSISFTAQKCHKKPEGGQGTDSYPHPLLLYPPKGKLVPLQKKELSTKYVHFPHQNSDLNPFRIHVYITFVNQSTLKLPRHT